MNRLLMALLAAGSAAAQTVTFDFDSGTPVLSAGQNVPFDQTASGLTATFSSPSGGAFSLQSDSSTGWKMSRFSGKYLYDNNQNRNVLNIRFSRPVTGISLNFATADFQQVEVPTTVRLAAYTDSTASAPVGSASAHGAYGSDTMPMGKLSFDAGGTPFNLVEIGIAAGQPLGAAAFFVDNITVIVAGTGTFTSVSAASYAGPVLAPGSIASGFGNGLAGDISINGSQPPPATLANTAVTVTDSAGVAWQAPLYYVSPTQINYIVPDGAAAGPASVTVSDGTHVTGTGVFEIAAVSPGLFTANFDGQGAPAGEAIGIAADMSETVQSLAQCSAAPGSCVTSPIDLPAGYTVVLVLYGTGFRGRGSLSDVAVKIGDMDCQVRYAGVEPQSAGLDRVEIVVPKALAGQGEVNVALTVSGKAANTVRVNIK